MWEKVKNLRWIKQAILILSAILLALLAGRAAHRESRARRGEKLAENLLQEGTKKAVTKAAKHQAKAAKDKEVGVKAREQMQQTLEKLGEENHTLDELAHHFNSERVRKRIDSETTGSNGSGTS